MMLTILVKQITLDIARCLDNPLSITGDICYKMLGSKAYINTLKKHLPDILDDIKKESFYLLYFKQFASIAHFRKLDLVIFRWFIAMEVD